jgi:hypothetical protein
MTRALGERAIASAAIATAAFSRTAFAQGIAVSATAAWSSQIIAFWGAIIIGTQAAQPARMSNAGSALANLLAILRLAASIEANLGRNDWLLASGLDNGNTRVDVVLVCWRTPADLRRLARSVAVFTTVFGTEWEVLVCGRRLHAKSTEPVRAAWMQSPRISAFCGARRQDNSSPFIPLDDYIVGDALNLLNRAASSASSTSGGRLTQQQQEQQQQQQHMPIDNVADDIATLLVSGAENVASRVTYITEVRAEMQVETTPARIFTSFAQRDRAVPFVAIRAGTGAFASSRHMAPRCATRTYALLSLTVAVGIALMAAASGRGLAVWLMAVRPALANLGIASLPARDAALGMLALDGAHMAFESAAGSTLAAGDAVVDHGLRWWQVVGVGALPCAELALLVAGWLYGAVRVRKLAPQGLVGHGMLWLAVVVGAALSARALFLVQRRRGDRIIGVRVKAEYARLTLATSRTAIPTGPLKLQASTAASPHSSASSPSPPASRSTSALPFGDLRLLATLLDSCRDDHCAISAAAALIRRPAISAQLGEYVVSPDVLGYRYVGDSLARENARTGAVEPLSATDYYPWLQASCCMVLTGACAAVSAVYAYVGVPSWVKPVAEALLACSAVWFATLDLTPATLAHTREAYTCHMVATLVISAVWYVGVRDVG